MTLIPSLLFLSFRSKVTSRPGTVGKKKGAAFGTLGGSFGLFLSYMMDSYITH